MAPDESATNGQDADQEPAQEESALRSMMSSYFLEYASYVIKDRAIPHIDDGLKPVQRRILHSLWEMDDGKFHKVANVVGNTMKFHPHGDASIYNALVHVANKEYFIDKQGNFGNIFTGDAASAARYIECRLSPLAREVLFNREITVFEASYDGRNMEPVTLPAKVPVLLMQGTEGIAVGMSTRVLPHNFNELLEAQIAILRGESFSLYPDFFQGGIMDVSDYEDGLGKVRLRALIDAATPKKLVIREIPATTTTEGLIGSIEAAVNRGKVKIASITDYTAESVEIEILLPRGMHADRVIKALYAYTDCEVSISTNCLVIRDNRPEVLPISDVLRYNTEKLVDDLRRELELALGKQEDLFHAKTLVQIFIENRIYKEIEECETNEAIFAAVYQGLAPFRDQLKRDVTDEDVEMLLRIPIRRISLFDINRNKQELDEILARIDEIQRHLRQLRRFAIRYLETLLKTYGKHYPRRTRLENIKEVNVREIALSNIKVGIDRSGGYVGTAVRSEEQIVCTEFDRIVIIKPDGTYKVMPIPDKLYVGPVCAVTKADKKQVYSMIYKEKKTRLCYAKRFRIDRYIMNREYRAAPAGCRVEKLLDRYGVLMRCEFQPAKRQRVDHCELDFDDIPIRAAGARGKRIAAKPITKFLQIKRGSDVNPDEQDGNAPEASANGTDEDGEKEPLAPELPQPAVDDTATVPVLRSPTSVPAVAAKPETDAADASAPPKKRAASRRQSASKAPGKTKKRGTSSRKAAKRGSKAKSAGKAKDRPSKDDSPSAAADDEETGEPREKPGRYLLDQDTDFSLEP